MEIVLLFGALMIGLLVFATAYKYVEVRRAARWLPAPGRVLTSQARARKVRTVNSMARAEAGADREVRNFAEVVYEYRVGGRTYRGNRIGVGEDLGDLFVEQTLARYPAGKPVRVYYDPAEPGRAVLERDAPEGVWRTMAILIAVAIVLLLAATFGLQMFVDALRANIARPERALPAALLAVMALLIGLVVRAAARQAEAAQSWPWVDGEIETAQVESFLAAGTSAQRWYRWRRYFRPDIVYRYRVGDVEFKGSRLYFAGRLYANAPWYAGSVIERYPAGSRVVVYYNPDNAAEAVLEPVAMGAGFGGALAALLAAGALYLAFF